MSREVLRELVSALSRLRREPVDFGRVDQWAGRLEQHLAELELLSAIPVSDRTEPAFAPSLMPAAGPAARTAGRPVPMAHPAEGPAVELGPPPRVATSVLAVLRELASGRTTVEEVVQQALQVAYGLGPGHAFIEVLEERARREAARPAPGEPALLWGVPVAVKDLLALEGHVMTGGSRVLPPEPAARDAEAVRRLVAEGAIVMGTTNLHELAYGITSENPHFGPVDNPRRPGHVAGGSSGGSAAAVAAGAVPAALGTDTGGSVRIPAAACGVAGLKPTYGRISREGVFPLSWSLDHVGPLAGTAGDVALLFAAMADVLSTEERDFARALATASRGAAPPGASLSGPLRAAAELAVDRLPDGTGASASERERWQRQALDGLRIGVPPDEWMGPLQAPVRRALAVVCQRLAAVGAAPVVVELPAPGAFRVAQFIILHAEATSVHRERLRAQWDRFGEDVRLRLKIGEFLTAVDYLQGQRMRRWLCDSMADVWTTVDLLLVPALPVLPPPLGTRVVTVDGEVEPIHRAMTRFTGPFNLTGLPAMALPVATSPEGLPIAVQLVTRWGQELDLLRAAIALESLLAS
ncbi:MAG: amidase [Firmicutes bacterium]|nr:amidase [Bacillota bacterium]